VKELQLRKWHRRAGIALALFLFLQAGTGIFLSLEELPLSKGEAHTVQGALVAVEPLEGATWDPAGSLHHGGGVLGALYRLALGGLTLWMASSGVWIYWKIRARSAGRKG
jgi:hypothetical protein